MEELACQLQGPYVDQTLANPAPARKTLESLRPPFQREGPQAGLPNSPAV